MIDLHYWPTPNGWKISIMLEECGLPYRMVPVNIGRGEQFTPEFIALINPHHKMPAIVDHAPAAGRAPLELSESGAILIYLADKAKKFLPEKLKYQTLQWLMFQMGGVGPMFGQAHHFMRAKKDEVPYGSERYGNEAKRLYGVMDRRLGEEKYFAGAEYTIADMAIYPWVARFEWHRVDLGAFPNVKRWFDELGARPAVQKGMAVPA